MRIDAHQHYWNIERGDLGWLQPDSLLYKSYMPEHLATDLHRHGIGGTIVVQAERSHEETDYLLSLAEKKDSLIAGVVGWLDLESPQYRQVYERWRKSPKFVGFRVMIQEMSDAQALLHPSYVEALSYFAELKQPIDLLMRSNQLGAVEQLLERVPRLCAVIDHLGKPAIAAGEWEPWAQRMRTIAGYPNVYCKLSGMVTEADHKSWRPSEFERYVRHAIECFGAGRVMFGSDWPVCLLAAEYDQCMNVLELSLPPEYGQAERDALYGGNAAKFYRLREV